MANQRDIKRRIGSVKNTQKITRAMKLVSAAKFARASHAVNASRPYSKAFDAMVKQLVGRSSEELSSPYLVERTAGSALLVICATDRGLCGSLNSAQLKAARQWLDKQKQAGRKAEILAWGRKAISWAKKQPETLRGNREKVLEKPQYGLASELAGEIAETFSEGSINEVFLCFSEFVNALTQEPKIARLLPVTLESASEEDAGAGDFLVEPGLTQMIDQLLERKLASAIYQALLEGAASEHGSRMTAMDNATTNADKVSKKLTLKYNRARQAAITKELIEIVSGAEAL